MDRARAAHGQQLPPAIASYLFVAPERKSKRGRPMEKGCGKANGNGF